MLRTLPKPLSTRPQHATVCAHFAKHGEALRNAASLLHGQTGEACFLRVLSELRTTTRLEPASRRSLVDLHCQLSLPGLRRYRGRRRTLAVPRSYGCPDRCAPKWPS